MMMRGATAGSYTCVVQSQCPCPSSRSSTALPLRIQSSPMLNTAHDPPRPRRTSRALLHSSPPPPTHTVLIATPWTGKESICVDGCPGNEVTLSTVLGNSDVTRRSLLVTEAEVRLPLVQGLGLGNG